MKTKRFIEFIILPALLVLSGCTQIREKAEQLMWEHSGVTEDFSYIQYQQMDAANALDEDGLYHSAELETYEKRQEKSGTVHVSFARNDFLHFDYYRDAALTEQLETSDCWLNPGEAVFAGDPEATAFFKATESTGLRLDYGQQRGKKRLACIATAFKEFHKVGAERYKEALSIILEAWDGDPDSLRSETVQGMIRFVDLYYGEYDRERFIKRCRRVDPLIIYREGKAMASNMPGFKKYTYQVLLTYNGSSKKSALPLKF